MIKKEILEIFEKYDKKDIHIWVLWGHSALDVCAGVKKHWFKTLVVAKKWREKTYSKYYKEKNWIWCIDEVLEVKNWWDMLSNKNQNFLREKNTIFIHSRYFWTYFDFEKIEKDFKIPIFWSRELLKLEERDVPKNQYYLLEKSWIRIPKIIKIPKLSYENSKLILEWDFLNWNKKLWLIKVNNAEREYERENFVFWNDKDFLKIAEEKLNSWRIKFETLKNAVIEEFVLWAQINFNYFYSKTENRLEIIWTDIRRQTSLDWFLRLPAKNQLELWKNFEPFHIETGHIAVTCKESLLEKAFEAWEKFIKTCKEEAQEIIWPFALQWAIETDWKSEELIVFDVSFRIPWSPWISATPYTNYLFWKNISMWERIWIELKSSLEKNNLSNLLT